MTLPQIRIFLLASLFFVGFLLYTEWQKEHTPVLATNQSEINKSGIPQVIQPEVIRSSPSDWINVHTDVLNVKIDRVGGDIVFAALSQYPKTLGSESGFVLLDQSASRYYVAQSGLIGNDDKGPDSRQNGRAHYQSAQIDYSLKGDTATVTLEWQHPDGIQVIKRFFFQKGSYLVKVAYDIQNATSSAWSGHFYGQIRREPQKEKHSFLMGAQMYQGAALKTADKPFKKMPYDDIKKHPYKETITGGWAAMLEHYFLCAFIPPKQEKNTFYTSAERGDLYNVGAWTPVSVAPHSAKQIEGGAFYIGPEIANVLQTISPGLELTVDYGILWPISRVLFKMMSFIHSYVGNWGVAIILVTMIIKLLFYSLSASSYRSMGKIRKLQSQIEALKARYGSDRQQMSVALMELYRKEKVNPFGGCLPILIQIPVFIALYYVLLESIELRQAPFVGWIQDLSSKDPFYVLPLIMGATMLLQTKLNPSPPDPMQEKIMLLMPVVFTALFLTFPAGLVLYWTVNNVLSILQQWFITRTLLKNP